MSRTAMPPSSTANSQRRCSMARKRASMREGPLAELFRATEAAQRQAERGQRGEQKPAAEAFEPPEETVGHAPPFGPAAPQPTPEPEPDPAPPADLRPGAALPR